MPLYWVNDAIKASVQVLDSNDDPATGATVAYKIYCHPTGSPASLVDSGYATHIADGIFEVEFFPSSDTEGCEPDCPYSVEFYSSNPKFRKTFQYMINGRNKAPHLRAGIGFNLDNSSDSVLEYAHGGGVIIEKIIIFVENDLTSDATFENARIYSDTGDELLDEVDLDKSVFTAGAHIVWEGTYAIGEIDYGPQNIRFTANALSTTASQILFEFVYTAIGTAAYLDSSSPGGPS